jgi:hypothetical protein
MSFAGRTVQWPESSQGWIFWLILLIGIFVTLRLAAGLPVALFGSLAAFAAYAVEGQFSIPPAIFVVSVLLYIRSRTSVQRISARRILRQAAVLGAGFLAYELGRYWNEGTLADAQRNASRIVDLEQRLGLFFEGRWQSVALRNDTVVELFNRTYSYLFLPVVVCVLLWLMLTDDENYRLLRNCLGISAALAVLIIALFPVAPPRLMPELGIVDSHDLEGLKHGFVNEFAAVPSLHVGWTTLTGYALFRSLRRSTPAPIALLAYFPALMIGVTVIVTGNHYWFDGLVGITISLGPALILARRADLTNQRAFVPELVRRGRAIAAATSHVIASSVWVRVSVSMLGSLLVYLIFGQIVDPGFTDYWGYMLAQIALTIVAVIWLSHAFRAEGGLSWITHVIVVLVTYLDTLGTAGHMYERHVSYDKIAHFGGAAALAAAAYDILRALHRRGRITWPSPVRMATAISISIVFSAMWEVYEFGADQLFHTYRHAGRYDTIYDLISDSTGAILTGLILWRLEVSARTVDQEEPSFDQSGSSRA